MQKSFHVLFSTVTVLLVLLLSAVHPLTAYADDGAPPETAPETESPPPPEESPASSDQVSPPAGEGDSETVTLPEVLEQAPEGTDVVVLDEQGEPLPLVTEEAAEIVATGDPVWCPATQLTPTPGLNGCTAGYASMAALLADLSALNGGTGPGADGTIWIEDSYDSSINDGAATDFTLDGSTLTTWNDYALIIQGGWDGVSGSTTITGTSEFNVPLIITNWNDAITLNDLLIFGSSATGLQVDTTGDITLSDVSSGSNGGGAYLDNSGGAGDIAITSSSFSFNDGSGLEAHSAGNISLTAVTAIYNDYDGAYLNNTSGAGDIDVASSSFNTNGFVLGGGLTALSAGEITLTDVLAYSNFQDGAYLDNTYGLGNISVTAGILASTEFTDNSGFGLEAYSNGDITLADFIANDNAESGAVLDNCNWDGLVCLSAGNISVGNGDFGDGSDGDAVGNAFGLMILTGGDADLSNVTAGDNIYNGAEIYAFSGGVTAATGDFSDNGDGSPGFGPTGFGLLVFAQDAVDLSDITASGNYTGGFGVLTESDITLTNVSAESNGEIGAILDNSIGTGDISVDPSSFSFNGGDGLLAYSAGNISLTDVTAIYNAYNGAYLDNTYGTGDILVDSSLFNTNGSGGGDGLGAYSNGNITLQDVTAGDNYGTGAYLDNSNGTGYIYVDPSVFNGNGSDDGSGLIALSSGNITLQDVTANGNYGNGAILINQGGTGYIYVDPSTFNSNGVPGSYSGISGLVALSSGDITLQDVTASGNGGDGASLISLGDIFVDTGYFNSNDFSGLSAYASGDVTISSVTADNNAEYGVGALADGDITITGIQTDGNGSDGAYLAACGDVSVDLSQFAGNGGYGLNVEVGGVYTEGVLVVGANTFGDTLITVIDCTTTKTGPALPTLPINVVPVTGGEGVGLDCALYRGTMLVLPDGDSLTFLCPTQGSASAHSLESEGLPGDLPDGVTFAAAIGAGLTGGDTEPLPGKIIISFVIPDGLEGADLAILFWDGGAWVDLHEASFDDGRTVYNGGSNTGDGHFEASTNFTGTFVLVTK